MCRTGFSNMCRSGFSPNCVDPVFLQHVYIRFFLEGRVWIRSVSDRIQDFGRVTVTSHMVERGRQLDKYSLRVGGSGDEFGNYFAPMDTGQFALVPVGRQLNKCSLRVGGSGDEFKAITSLLCTVCPCSRRVESGSGPSQTGSKTLDG